MSKKKRTLVEKLGIYHRWNSRTGLYPFIGKTILKLLVIIAIIAVIVLVLNHFLNLGDIIKNYIFSHETPGILTLFLVSESFLGWIPPDLFIMWSDKFNSPLLWLTILGTISYLGGINAYFLGKIALRIPKLRHWLEKRNEEFFIRIRKWGGIIIVLAALFPLPFATTTTVAGMVKYPLKLTMLYGLTRYIRFYLYGVLIFFGMDKIM
ncbi:MAG: hypothetical protein II937_09785 [Bacteroidales bacterium]|nr:hypothetical protein [Bacteroidales bacterium]